MSRNHSNLPAKRLFAELERKQDTELPAWWAEFAAEAAKPEDAESIQRSAIAEHNTYQTGERR